MVLHLRICFWASSSAFICSMLNTPISTPGSSDHLPGTETTPNQVPLVSNCLAYKQLGSVLFTEKQLYFLVVLIMSSKKPVTCKTTEKWVWRPVRTCTICLPPPCALTVVFFGGRGNSRKGAGGLKWNEGKWRELECAKIKGESFSLPQNLEEGRRSKSTSNWRQNLNPHKSSLCRWHFCSLL